MAPGASPRRISLAWLAALLWPLALAADDELFFKGAEHVNEGELTFLTALPAKPVHHFQNHLHLDDASLDSGWVRLEQCHDHLDAVPRAQIVYGADRIRDLKVTHSENIARAWAESASIQMEGVTAGARLCLSGMTLALTRLDDGHYVLRNGPYMRRFLDGFYPMKVSMTVNLDTPRLTLEQVTPPAQSGFVVWQNGQQLGFVAQFEGILRTELRFHATP